MAERSVRVEVRIFGERYTLLGDISPEEIEEIAGYVDEVMREVAQKNPRLGLSRIAVLAALNIAAKLFKTGYRPDMERNSEHNREKEDERP